MSEKKNQKGGGIGFLSLLAIVFIVLRLTEVISWSWLWVLAPLWIPAAIWAIVIVTIFVLVTYGIQAGEKK